MDSRGGGTAESQGEGIHRRKPLRSHCFGISAHGAGSGLVVSLWLPMSEMQLSQWRERLVIPGEDLPGAVVGRPAFLVCKGSIVSPTQLVASPCQNDCMWGMDTCQTNLSAALCNGQTATGDGVGFAHHLSELVAGL